MAGNSGLLSGIDDVVVREDLPTLGLGVYPELEVEQMFSGVAFKSKLNYCRVTVKVIKSDGAGAMPAGTRANLIFTETPYPNLTEQVKGDIKSLCAAVAKVSPNEIKAHQVGAMFSDEQPATGNTFAAIVTQKVGKDGEPKTFSSGAPVPQYRFSAI